MYTTAKRITACKSCLAGPRYAELISMKRSGSGNSTRNTVANVTPHKDPGRPTTTIVNTKTISLREKEDGSM
jgi:hypothetical protein